MVAESTAFVLVMFLLVRPRLNVLVTWRVTAGLAAPHLFAVVLVGILLVALSPIL